MLGIKVIHGGQTIKLEVLYVLEFLVRLNERKEFIAKAGFSMVFSNDHVKDQRLEREVCKNPSKTNQLIICADESHADLRTGHTIFCFVKSSSLCPPLLLVKLM